MSEEFDDIQEEPLDEEQPVDEEQALDEAFILSLTPEQQEICNQINRRTDFVVTGRDYVPKVRKRR